MKMIALLRGINVGGNRKVPMPQLVNLLENSGLNGVHFYINTGNLVFKASQLKPERIETIIENTIEKEFGFKIEVMVRTASKWTQYSTHSPFPRAEAIRPNMLHLGLSKIPLKKDIAETLLEKALYGEKIKILKGVIWVDFFKSVGRSKLTPTVFTQAAGSPVTMRNWNTVLKLNEMLKK